MRFWRFIMWLLINYAEMKAHHLVNCVVCLNGRIWVKTVISRPKKGLRESSSKIINSYFCVQRQRYIKWPSLFIVSFKSHKSNKFSNLNRLSIKNVMSVNTCSKFAILFLFIIKINFTYKNIATQKPHPSRNI